MQRSTGKPVPELDVPPLPAACKGAWSVFVELCGRRGSNGFGANPIDEARLCYWQQLHGIRLTPWEIDAISSLDGVWLAAQAQASAKTKT